MPSNRLLTVLKLLAVVAAVALPALIVFLRGSDGGETVGLGKLAFVRAGDLWVKDLDSGRERRLTGGGAASSPMWSPSGKWVLYTHGPPAELADIGTRLVRADGSRERRLEVTWSAAWSPSEDLLALALSDGTLVLENADGSGRRTLLPAVPGGGTLDRRLGLKWSGAGRWLVFEEQHQDHRSVDGGYSYIGFRAVRSDGTDERELFKVGITPHGIPAEGPIPAGWAAHGAPAYMSLSGLTEPDVVDGLPLRLQAFATTRTDPLPGVRMLAYEDFLALSPDGNLIALVQGVALGRYPADPGLRRTPPPVDLQTDKHIVLMDMTTGTVQRLTGPNVVAVSPSWSPDGPLIAYVARPDNGPADLTMPDRGIEEPRRVWVMRRDGSEQRRLTADDADCRQERPMWSRDGSQLVFACVGDGSASLRLVSTSGGPSTLLAAGLSVYGSEPRAALPEYQGHIDWPLLFDWWRGPP